MSLNVKVTEVKAEIGGGALGREIKVGPSAYLKIIEREAVKEDVTLVV